MTFRKRLNELESEIGLKFNELLFRQSSYSFYSKEDIEEGDLGDYFEMRSDITGNVSDIHIVAIKEGDIMAVSDFDNVPFSINFSDLGSISDRISLIELMEINLCH